MRNWAKNVSRAALVAGGLTVVGMGLSTGSAFADAASGTSAHQGTAVHQGIANPPGGGSGSDGMPPVAKSVRKLVRSVGIPVPGSDSGPNDPQVPPRLPIEGLPFSVGGKAIPGLS
ncbi:hypothetical protein [Actinomadura harenae]|uniref:ATP-binding protein n=1 Tax=Actinomadura harenae TaxID=2483351 RepID=A0A3M2LQ76_9ACTN|nr:hypothetical protein [Actinomadura harenae]RMI39644.1 hypothetical protein EBO15_29200 [Actinomadura harenae]